MSQFFVLQKKSDPSIYYKEKRGQWKRGVGYVVTFIEVSDLDKAKKYKSVSEINNSLSRAFNNTLKSQIPNIDGGMTILKCTKVLTITKEEQQIGSETAELVKSLEQLSTLVKETHYSTVELYNKLRNSGEISKFKYILSTSYDRLNTSKLQELFEQHGLNPIKYKGNFAFDREEFWTAAKMICDVPFKSFNLT